ncbi:MAG: amino acid decarboxylase, partial [Oscillospiraceae bacterium]|nr:amino acid decarboxylase [Oscillospiraceae bacterium]
REALSAPAETLPAREALGRVAASVPAVCPPAIPVAMPGERLGPEALALLDYYGVERVEVLRPTQGDNM